MNIGVIGTGNMGTGLAKAWSAKGHKVLLGSRDPAKAKKLAPTLGKNVTGGSIAEAAKHGDVVLLAVHWPAVPGALKAAGDLKGKTLIDCTNPLTSDFMGLVIGHTTSGGEEVAKLAKGATVVKAFSAVTAQVIHSSPLFGREAATVLYCGDDAGAKKTVASLISDIGFDPVDNGGLQNARFLEPLAVALVHLAYPMGMGPEKTAFKVLRRPG